MSWVDWIGALLLLASAAVWALVFITKWQHQRERDVAAARVDIWEYQIARDKALRLEKERKAIESTINELHAAYEETMRAEQIMRELEGS